MNHIDTKQNTSNLSSRLSLIYFAILGFLVFLFFSILMVFSGVFKKLHPLIYNFHYLVMLHSVKTYLYLSPIKFNIKNLNILSENKDKKIVLIANHRSHLDMFILLTVVYKLKAVANSYLFKVPLLGNIMKLSDHFNLERGNVKQYLTETKKIRKAISKFDKVLFFPETTRCEPGSKSLQKFRLPAFQIAFEEEAYIIPIIIRNTDSIWPKGESAIHAKNNAEIEFLPVINSQNFKKVSELAKYTKLKIEEGLYDH